MTCTDVPTWARENPSMSALALEDGVVYLEGCLAVFVPSPRSIIAHNLLMC